MFVNNVPTTGLQLEPICWLSQRAVPSGLVNLESSLLRIPDHETLQQKATCPCLREAGGAGGGGGGGGWFLDTSQWEPRINVKEGGGGGATGTYVHHKVSVLVSSTRQTISFLQLTRSSLWPHPRCLFTTTGSQGSFLTKYCLVEIRSHCFLWEGGSPVSCP